MFIQFLSQRQDAEMKMFRFRLKKTLTII
jgi:hypothetical protein